MIDLYRKILDVALQSCRLHQSKVTGFVHDTPETISLYTNALFALALLRQKTQESIQEAKFVLDRFLSFQNESGNFPEYMHDFPVCRNHQNAAKMLLPLRIIQKEFAHILGEALSKKLNHSIDSATAFSQQYPKKSERSEEMAPKALGELIVEKGTTPELLKLLSQTWHAPSKKYCGKAAVNQVGFSPEITLYDYILGYFSECPNEAILRPQFAAIQAALLPAQKAILDAGDTKPYHIQLQKNREPLSLVAGLHTLLFALPTASVESVEEGKIVVELAEEILPDNIEKADVLSLFVDALPDVSIFVNGQKSTTFHLSDIIDVKMGEVQLQLSFAMTGAPEYIGHIMKGNRPRQMLSDRAYDWQILLRKVRGSGKSRLTVYYKVL